MVVPVALLQVLPPSELYSCSVVMGMLPDPPMVFGWIGARAGVAALITIMVCALESVVVDPLPFFTTWIVQGVRPVRFKSAPEVISVQAPLSI